MSLYDKVYKTPREPYRRIFSKAFNTSLVIHNQFNVIHNAMSAFLKHSSSWPCDFFFDTYLLPSSCFCKMNFSPHQTTYQSSFHNPKDFSCLFFFSCYSWISPWCLNHIHIYMNIETWLIILPSSEILSTCGSEIIMFNTF